VDLREAQKSFWKILAPATHMSVPAPFWSAEAAEDTKRT